MRLPFLESAVVEERKITSYLLSDENSEGKSAFFAAFGFTPERWELLRDALLEHAATHEVYLRVNSQYGAKYIIEGALQTPIGRTPQVRSVWILENGLSAPRLVTAYPLEEEPHDPRT